ncbi:MAG: sugar phosphate isomerase/epimerase family protein, partial [Armatimonadota bacterium]
MRPMEVGVFLSSTGIMDPFEATKKLGELGVKSCQVGFQPPEFYTAENAASLKACMEENGVTPTLCFCGFQDESYADVAAVRETVGYLNPDTLPERMDITMKVIDFAWDLGAEGIAAHIGFVPPDKNDPGHKRLVETVQKIADAAKAKGLNFHLETGQERAHELLEFIHEVDRDNVFINFDPANMILYGMDKPIEALELLKDYVRSVHCKDGVWPTEEGKLGEERPLGAGQVDIPAFVAKLKEIGYTGPLTIEREAGDDRIGDILKAKALLE